MDRAMCGAGVWRRGRGGGRGGAGGARIFPQEQCELCSIDLQTEGTLRPRTARFADHLGFLEAVA